jgi:hypothetical protein
VLNTNSKKNLELDRLLKQSGIATNISIYFASKVAGEEYDPYEQNYTDSYLNPVTVKGYVRDITPEALVWKQYGLTESGAKEFICSDKYEDWFKKASKIVINGDEYSLYKQGLGTRVLITHRPQKILRIVLFKK